MVRPVRWRDGPNPGTLLRMTNTDPTTHGPQVNLNQTIPATLHAQLRRLAALEGIAQKELVTLLLGEAILVRTSAPGFADRAKAHLAKQLRADPLAAWAGAGIDGELVAAGPEAGAGPELFAPTPV